ncbi:hypothetical protein AAFF_G00343960 [Aldrovandia affinis]|uniref:H15 domain-containing protein n=1 Tax=Aldrovandia affinis TaxID=143900 RepID=A0AAD7SM69_9TELE|nr:hypothetical protein AAFF_G00343960 [Aldrovandia affinis]
MPPKKSAPVEVSAPEKPSPDASKKPGKPSLKPKLDAGEPPTTTAVRKTATHPPTMVMVKEALKALDTRKGSSAQAIRGYILEKYTTVDPIRFKYMLRKALVKGIESGDLVRPANSAGNGAQGRFRLAVRVKTKVPKVKEVENSDPNVEEPSMEPKNKTKAKAKAKGAGSEKLKPVAKKVTAEVSSSTEPPEEAPPSKVAPAKRPKKPVGTKEVAKPKARSNVRKAKAPANLLEGEDVLAKKPGKRGKKSAE